VQLCDKLRATLCSKPETKKVKRPKLRTLCISLNTIHLKKLRASLCKTSCNFVLQTRNKKSETSKTSDSVHLYSTQSTSKKNSVHLCVKLRATLCSKPETKKVKRPKLRTLCISLQHNPLQKKTPCISV
jgi:hypothetical protein